MSDSVNCTEITVPDEFDSMSRVVLNNETYYLRFTYNDTFDYWSLSVYDSMEDPLVESIKIVVGIPLNIFCPTTIGLPKGVFVAVSALDRIGRDDFKNGKVTFLFIPQKDDDTETVE